VLPHGANTRMLAEKFVTVDGRSGWQEAAIVSLGTPLP
jgi:hypothetical protein